MAGHGSYMEAAQANLDILNSVKGPQDLTVPQTLEEVAVTPAEDLSNDEICIAIREDDPPDTVLKTVLMGLAEEQNSLKDLRVKKGKDGKDTSFISLKRGTLLKYMSETLIQKQALVGIASDLDLRGPKFREVFKLLLTIISNTFDEIKIPAEYREMFFHSFKKNLDGWEIKAEKLAKSVT
jgi:hypothetical protein